MTVIINNKTAVHKASGGILITQDICLTSPQQIPVTYQNVALSKDADKTEIGILINGHPTCTVKSTFAKSIGDEPSNMGIISGTKKGKAKFLRGSPNVFFNGKSAARQGDLMTSNNGNTPPSQLQQPGILLALHSVEDKNEFLYLVSACGNYLCLCRL